MSTFVRSIIISKIKFRSTLKSFLTLKNFRRTCFGRIYTRSTSSTSNSASFSFALSTLHSQLKKKNSLSTTSSISLHSLKIIWTSFESLWSRFIQQSIWKPSKFFRMQLRGYMSLDFQPWLKGRDIRTTI